MYEILEYLKDDRFWEETYEKMMEKTNFNEVQLNELTMLRFKGFKEQAIEDVIKGTYEWSIPDKQLLNKIGTTKKRVVYIHSMQDRYFLGVLYRVCSEYFKDSIDEHCFSYKKGVRTLNAVEYLVRDKKLFNKYGLKLDISGYFNSVDKGYLTKVVDELFSGMPELYKLMKELLFRDKVKYKGRVIEEYSALIPGCALGSFYANYCLRELDSKIAGEMGLTYARYSDDIILFSDKKEELESSLKIIKEKLKECGLSINPKKYEWFEPGDTITFLGLKMWRDSNRVNIDISENSKRKMMKKIKFGCRYGRRQIELGGVDPYKQAKKFFKRHNYRIFKCYIEEPSRYGWAYYAFRYINCIDSMRELDFYTKDRVRQMITGKNNSANITKVSDEMLRELGYVSLVEMYNMFLDDFDVYCDKVSLMRC